MFKSLGRSRSLKSLRARGGGTPAADDQDVLPPPARHGPESPVLGQDMPGPVSDAPQTPTKQQGPASHITSTSPSSSHLSSSPPLDNDGANAYVSRPLPEPPTRSSARLAARQTATAERPSTSAGPGTGTGSFKMFAEARSQPRSSAAGKRMSKDDLYISTHSSRSFRSYHIPIRGQPPSPTASPRSRSPDRTITVRTQTPDSIAGSNPAAPIGMAIGSPSFAPPVQPPTSGGSWQPQLRGMDVKPPWEEPPEPAPAKKPSKWRLFGLLGSKKEPKDRQSTTPDLASTPMSESRPKTASSMRYQEDMGRSNTTAAKKAKKVTPLVVRSNTEPAVEFPSASLPKEPKTPKAPRAAKQDSVARKASTKSLREGIKKSDISAPMPASAPPMPVSAPPMPPMPTSSTKGFLDVDIPDVKMERYSVMFNGILQPGGGQPPKNSRNSTFLKRQATLKRLQRIQDAIMEEERAKEESTPSRTHSPSNTRDTNPTDRKDTTSTADNDDTRTVSVTAPPLSSHQTHTKSPSFSLFPATPSASSNRGRTNTASRSTASPSVLSSPTKAQFELMDPPGRAPSIVPPPPIRSDTPESRTRSQMSQKSQDIPILLDGDERGRGFSPLTQQPVNMARAEQKGYRQGRSRSSSRSTQHSEQTLQAREASQTRPAPNSNFERITKPAPLNIGKGPQQQAQSRTRSDSRTRIPQPIQTSQQQQRPKHLFRQDQSALVLDSPTDTSTGTFQRTAPSEPAWQMMSPPSSSISSASTSTSSRKRSPSSASSTYTQGSNYVAGTYTPATSHAPTASVDEADAGKNPVEVSIARQISISRQQRNLLQQPGARARPWMRADVTPPGVGSARVRKVGADGERIGGTRASRPTYMRGGSPEVNRKSERIVVEGV